MYELLARAHLAGVPTSRTLWAHVAKSLDTVLEEVSETELVSGLLKASLQHPLAVAAPRSTTHAREVLQWLRDQWRARGWNLPSEFIPEEISCPDYAPEVSYKTYVGWGGSVMGQVGVTLLESDGGITHNTTGLTTWYGAAILAQWASDNPAIIAGRRVMELGAGVGFTASVILTSPAEGQPPPLTYTLTDCHHHVLTLLQHNLTLNLASSPPKREELEKFQREVVEVGDGRVVTKVGVLQVDWRRPPPLPPVDVVLAADVVYARHLIPALVTLIRSILDGSADEEHSQDMVIKRKSENRSVYGQQGKTEREECNMMQHPAEREGAEFKEKQRISEEINEEDKVSKRKEEGVNEREAYIACTRRNQETLSVFLEEVQHQGLSHTLVYQATLGTDTALFLYNETHLPVKIYKITLPHNVPHPDV
ncbi:protein-lysine N-methyltransferase EEF2KMT isoform X2 [Cherax quadricarinatus]|uniref:protein-lysine N-methyltransferase EEF2KMT isoform X2 n=1 Tax=Cherax quadricarinatus TaxID=27406 RepID=UPI002378B734|nr:protein-lysine N-methyltransferase EEF2KMT-like isoform X2 [Cherax quadricarinatus]